MQHNKPLSNSHKEITSIDEAFKILYTQKKDSITFIPTLSQVRQGKADGLTYTAD